MNKKANQIFFWKFAIKHKKTLSWQLRVLDTSQIEILI